METITAIVGILMILLMFGLLALFLMEYLAYALNLRGRVLDNTLEQMFQSGNGKLGLFHHFKNSPTYLQNARRRGKRYLPPPYLSGEVFGNIIVDLLNEINKNDYYGYDEGGYLGKLMENYSPDSLSLVRNHQFITNISSWFQNKMDQCVSSYKQKVMQWLIIIGLFLAIIFNIDTLQMFKILFDSSDNSSLLGWSKVPFEQLTLLDWILKAIGWLISSLGISFNAFFLFDILKKIVSIRFDGLKPFDDVTFQVLNQSNDFFQKISSFNQPENYTPSDTTSPIAITDASIHWPKINDTKWMQIKVRLRTRLVQLYGDQERRERLAADAGIPLHDINLEGTATSVWDRILKEARKQNKIRSLLEIATIEYPEDDTIRLILEVWQQDA